MERVLAAAILSMAISILAGPKLIAFLRAKEFGQYIREEGPADHLVKQGTPTMGGILFILSAVMPFLILSRYTFEGLTVFFVTLACAGIGFADDFIKNARRAKQIGDDGIVYATKFTRGAGWSVYELER